MKTASSDCHTPDLLRTVGQAANQLAMSRAALYSAVWAGEIEVVRLGHRRIRIRQSVIDRIVSQGWPPKDKSDE